MSDLPRPITRRHTWQSKAHTVYLPPNLITGGAAGRITRQVYGRDGSPVRRHVDYGFPIHRYYYMTEVKFENDNTFVDLWQVMDIAQADAQHAMVTLHFCTHLNNGTFDPIPVFTEKAGKYRRICMDAIERAKGN